VPVYNEKIETLYGLLKSVIRNVREVEKDQEDALQIGLCVMVNNVPDASEDAIWRNSKILIFLNSIVSGDPERVFTEDGDEITEYRDWLRDSKINISVLDGSTKGHSFAGNNVGYARDRLLSHIIERDFAKDENTLYVSTDADCKLRRGFVVDAVNYFKLHPEVGAISAQWVNELSDIYPEEARSYYLSDSGSKVKTISAVVSPPTYFHNLGDKEEVQLAGSGTCAPLKTILKHPHYPHIPGGEDSALEHELRLKGVSIGSAPRDSRIVTLVPPRYSDRAAEGTSHGQRILEYKGVDQDLRIFESNPFYNAVFMVLEEVNSYWSDFTHSKRSEYDRQNFRNKVESLLMRRYRFSKTEAVGALNCIFDHPGDVNKHWSKLPSPTINKFFQSFVFHVLRTKPELMHSLRSLKKQVDALLKKSYLEFVDLCKGAQGQNFIESFSPEVFSQFIHQKFLDKRTDFTDLWVKRTHARALADAISFFRAVGKGSVTPKTRGFILGFVKLSAICSVSQFRHPFKVALADEKIPMSISLLKEEVMYLRGKCLHGLNDEQAEIFNEIFRENLNGVYAPF
jgi:hypothetical protein